MIKLFALAVPPDLQARVLRGEQQADLPVTALPDAAKELLDKLKDSLDPHRTINGVPEEFRLDRLKFYTTAVTGSDGLMRTIWMEPGNGGGYSFMGMGMYENGVRNLVKAL